MERIRPNVQKRQELIGKLVRHVTSWQRLLGIACVLSIISNFLLGLIRQICIFLIESIDALFELTLALIDFPWRHLGTAVCIMTQNRSLVPTQRAQNNAGTDYIDSLDAEKTERES